MARDDELRGRRLDCSRGTRWSRGPARTIAFRQTKGAALNHTAHLFTVTAQAFIAFARPGRASGRIKL
jgi:hypothetical protein